MGEEYRPAYADSLVTAFSTQEDAIEAVWLGFGMFAVQLAGDMPILP